MSSNSNTFGPTDGSVTVSVSQDVAYRAYKATGATSRESAVARCLEWGLWFYERMAKSIDDMPIGQVANPSDNASHAQSSRLGVGRITKEVYEKWWRSLHGFGYGPTNEEMANAFWEYLEAFDFTNSKNQTITLQNIKGTFYYWKQIHDRDERRAREKDEKAAAEAKVASETSFSRNRSMLEELPFD